MTLVERWEDRKPVARVGFFGRRGPELDEVYDWKFAGPGMLALAVNRSNHLASVAITADRLIYLVDTNPRQAGGYPADARVFLDPDLSIDVVTKTMRLFSIAGMDLYEAMVDFMGDRVRALIGAASISEVVPLVDDGDFNFINIANETGSELWPEIGHKR